MRINKLSFIKSSIIISFLCLYGKNTAQDSIHYNDEVSKILHNYDIENRIQSNTPGWTTSLYKKNAFEIVKSYGYKSINDEVPIDQKSTFRIASISKIFTSISVMILAQENKLALDKNIQSYLDFDLKLKYPINLKHLLTHTAGFEDKFYNDSSLEKTAVESLENHLKNAMPKQIYKPGEIISYSNYGNALAALIVEKISKMSFYKFVQKRILEPTGMNNSSYILKPSIKKHLVNGYNQNKGELEYQPYFWIHRYPASTMMTTSEDILKLIKMLINHGKGENGKVLSKESINFMFSTQFTPDKDLPGMGLGWMELVAYNNSGYWHDGSIAGYKAVLVILPKQNSGYFISCNNKDSYLPDKLKYQYLRDIFPGTVSIPKVTLLEDDSYSETFSGNYINSRQNLTSFEKISNLTNPTLEISKTNEGLLLFKTLYKPYKKNGYINIENNHKLIFEKSEKYTKLHINWYGAPRTYIKQNILEKGRSQIIIIAILLFFLAIHLIINLIKIKKKKEKGLWWVFTGQLCFLTFFISSYFYLNNLNSLSLRLGEITLFKIILFLPVIALICTLIAIINKIKTEKIGHDGGILISLFICGWLFYWNLMGWEMY